MCIFGSLREINALVNFFASYGPRKCRRVALRHRPQRDVCKTPPDSMKKTELQ